MSPFALLEEARAMDRSGRKAAALLLYRRFLAQAPGHAPALADFSGLLLELGRPEEAARASGSALEADGACLEARINLASALQSLGDLEGSRAQYQEALRADPLRVEAHAGLAWTWLLLDRPGEALDAAERALALSPCHKPALEYLVRIHARRGDPAGLRRAWDALVALGFQGDAARWEASEPHLVTGDFEKGWDLYEARWDLPGLIQPERAYAQPPWDGAPFPGRTLLLHWEQGYGDTVMMARFAQAVKARGGRVVASVQAPLAPLLATCPGFDEVLPEGAPLPPFDLHLPFMSLPRVLETRLDTIPAPIPYVSVPEGLPGAPAIEALLARGRGLRVGLACAGNPTHRRDAIRSIPPEELALLAGARGVTWFDLQRGEEPPFPGMLPLGDLFPDFAHSALGLSGLDLIVTVDTAVAHLAGALGLPALLLLPLIPDWRWLLGRADSPWYPTLRLLRQELPGRWEPVLRQVLARLPQA